MSPSLSQSSASHYSVQRYDSPLELFNEIAAHLERREAEANIILPQLLKLRRQKLSHLQGDPTSSSSSNWPQASTSASKYWTPDFWLVLRHDQAVEFVLSCTNGPLGSYPIFIWSASEVDTLPQTFITTSMDYLAHALNSELPSDMSKRVYSVFAPTPLTFAFSSSWSQLTKKFPLVDPYYEATFAKVSRATLSLEDKNARPAPFAFELRQATSSDVAGVADLCFEFAATSDPFILDADGATQEAKYLISQQCAFVCEVQGQIVCLVAVTRTSGKVAAITKVVTHTAWGKQGWAKRLVRFVCQRLLCQENKDEVVLYVARGNGAAESAYHSVGFGGLRGSQRVPGVDADWLELGFADTELGHW